MDFLKLIWVIICEFFDIRTEAAQDAWDERDWLKLALNILLMAFAIILGIGVPLFLVYRFRRTIIAILAPVFMLAILIASFFENRRPLEVSSTPPADIEIVRSRARSTYPTLKQTAYLLFRDLCRYLPGLVAPFSTSAVVAPVNFDFTASMVTLFHFVIAKGESDVTISTMKEILESLIDQRLRAQDLPLSVPAIYTAADGSTWPGLVVDGIYDIGQQYRVDLVITSEAEVARLQARGVNSLESESRCAAPHDPDFD